MKKITFLMLHLGYGGAEQAVIAQANLLVEKYNVEIISFYKLYENPAFEVDPRIEIKYLTENVKPNREEIKKSLSILHICSRNYTLKNCVPRSIPPNILKYCLIYSYNSVNLNILEEIKQKLFLIIFYQLI